MDKVSNHLQDGQHLVIDRLTFAKPFAKLYSDGFIGGLSVNTAGLSDPLIESLVEIFTGQLMGDSTYLITISDNNEMPIIYDNDNDALAAAAALTSNIIRRYLYGLFSTYGVKPRESHAITPTLHFVRNIPK